MVFRLLLDQAEADITEEFTHRPWHAKVECSWNRESLLLTAENDFDTQGLALSDEFSDAIASCIPDGFDGRIRMCRSQPSNRPPLTALSEFVSICPATA